MRDRLSLEVHEQIFGFVIGLAERHHLLSGKTVRVDATTLEANAAMKSIIRKDTGEDWREYLRRLMLEDGLIEEDEKPSAEEFQRFDRTRKGKKTSNKEWESTTDSDCQITKMKDGRTHLAYKAEHAVDLDTELVLAACVYTADQSDGDTLLQSTAVAQTHLNQTESQSNIKEVAADKGYHKNQT